MTSPSDVRSLKAALVEFDRAIRERLGHASGEELSRERAEMVEHVVQVLFEPFAPDGLALVATGGFGSQVLTPGSDVDLLFVHRGNDKAVEKAVAGVLYPLWDAGLRVSHAVRTPQECETESANRLESLTAMATARLLIGDRELGREACERSLSVARRDLPGFVTKLRAARREREMRSGRVSHLLEPDLKESLGGVRDRQLWTWIAWTLRERIPMVLPVPEPRPLLDARIALHVVNGGTSNRLAAEHHDAVARILRIAHQPGWERRDLLMRRVWETGTAIDLWATRLLDQIEARLEGKHPSTARTGRPPPLNGAQPEVRGSPWPRGLLRSFLGSLRDEPDLEEAFEQTRDVLSTALPEWEDVKGRPQRDPYHRYPVDVHLLQTVTEARRLLNDPGESFAAEASNAVTDPDALLLGALLHDIGKVGKGSHVPAGADIAARIVDRMGVERRVRNDVLFLVAEHLLLADSATRRNIHDEDLVLRVAERIGTQERLGLLYLLTLADATATGPSACTPWRMNLIRDLVSKVSLVIERGHVDSGRVERLTRAEASVREALRDRPHDDVEAFLQSVPSAYLLSVHPADVAVHFRMMGERPRPDEARVEVRRKAGGETSLVTVVALDRLGLLADIAGALSVSGLSILAAQAFTSERGITLDEFEVRGAFEPEVPLERWDRFRATLSGVLRGDDLDERVRSIRVRYQPAQPAVPVRVRTDQESSDFFTVVEVEGSDRIGLLFDLGRSFTRSGIDVHVAKVATYGPRVVDVFYVTDEAGDKVEDPQRLADLERALIEAASS